jgi:hypothetical protein
VAGGGGGAIGAGAGADPHAAIATSPSAFTGSA